MFEFSIGRTESGQQVIDVNVDGVDPETVNHVGYVVDWNTSRLGINPATPDHGRIRRELAADANTDMLRSVLGQLGAQAID
jgi:hypothetical protein